MKKESALEKSIRRVMEEVLEDVLASKNYLTKDDLEDVLSSKNYITKGDLASAMENVVKWPEFEYAIRDLKETMVTKEEFYQRMDLLEPMLTEFRDFQRKNALTGKQLCDMDDKIADHEKRLRVLEV